MLVGVNARPRLKRERRSHACFLCPPCESGGVGFSRCLAESLPSVAGTEYRVRRRWAPGGFRRHSLPPPALLDWLLCASHACSRSHLPLTDCCLRVGCRFDRRTTGGPPAEGDTQRVCLPSLTAPTFTPHLLSSLYLLPPVSWMQVIRDGRQSTRTREGPGGGDKQVGPLPCSACLVRLRRGPNRTCLESTFPF